MFARLVFKTRYRAKRFLDVIAFFNALPEWDSIQKSIRKRIKNSKISDKETLELINSNRANDITPIKRWIF